MKIVADENLKYVEQLFAEYGDLHLLPGREIDSAAVADADVLLIRSVTRVDKQLLLGSQVKFVGSATSGVEHVDQNYLGQHGIYFSHAKGSNALAVAQYCTAALCFSQAAGKFDFQVARVGIVGCGFVGSALALLLRSMGVAVSVFDPFLGGEQAEKLRNSGVVLAELAAIFECEAVSLHVPLTGEGPYPTAHMIDESLLARLSPTATFINASRGGVVNERALLTCLNNFPELFAVLDVWDAEPQINPELLQRANIATPHMAGYSRRAKARATQMLWQQYSEGYLQSPPLKPANAWLDPKALDKITVTDAISAIKKALPLDVLTCNYKKESLSLLPDPLGLVFDSFRKSMIDRAEFSDFEIADAHLESAETARLETLGFVVNKCTS
ncbi:MAG: erythronate-4-phosphate dehydrogenase [Pseudohongiellaceae bacterium]|jgi:erythronate-4-phosphate dehydrogenase